ncbi:MAG: ATP-binding protein, partial [Anaerolineales bacterium]|nr:ATP-binding protein [Anaerolineales bacterium]
KYAFPAEYLLSNSSETNYKISVQLQEHDDQLLLSVSDNGIGIPPQINWQATNTLGLLLVNILTNQLNGTIEKKPGKGTTFLIRFKRKP